MIPRDTLENPEENCAAPGAADNLQGVQLDADLRVVIDRWHELPDPVKAGVVAIIRATSE